MQWVCALFVSFLVGHRSSLFDSEALFYVPHICDLFLGKAAPYLGIPFVLCLHAFFKLCKQSLDFFNRCVHANSIAQGYLPLRQCWKCLPLAVGEGFH